MKRFAIILALVPLPLLAQTTQEEEDKGFLVSLIEDNLSGEGHIVSISGFKGALSSEATLTELTVADTEGVWLTLRDVVLDWNRAALLSGAVDVNALKAAEVIVSRAPVAEASATDALPSAEATPFSLPDLPVSIDIGEMSVARFELGDSFLGTPLIATLSGSADLGGGEGQFDLKVNRLEGPSGAFSLAGGFINETRVLDANFSFQEAAGGLVSGLIGLPNNPSIDLTVKGTAPIENFVADIALATDGADRLSGQLQVIQADAGLGFDLDISGDVSPLFAPEYSDFLGPDVALKATGAQTTAGYDLSALSLTAQSLSLDGSAQIGTSGFPTAFDLTGTMADPTGDIVLLPLTGPKTFVTHADLSVQFDAAQSDEWRADITAREFDRPGLLIEQLDLTGGGVIRAATGEVTADMTYGATGLKLDDSASNEALGNRIDGTFKLATEAGAPIEISEMTIKGAGIDVELQATVETAETVQVDTVLQADVKDISRFSALTGQNLGGGGSFNVIANATPLDGLFDVLLSGETNDLKVGIEQIDPLLAGIGRLSGSATRDTKGTRVKGLLVETGAAVIHLDADVTNDGGTAEFSAELTEISLIEPRLNGPANLTGTARLNSEQKVDLDATLTAFTDQIDLTATLSPSTEGQTVSANLNLKLADLARYAGFTAKEMSGAVTGGGRVTLLSDQTRFTAQLDLETQDLQTGFAQLDPVLLGAGNWTADLTRLGETQFDVNTLEGSTPYLQIAASGKGDLNGAIAGEVDLTLPEAARVAPGLPGEMSLIATVDRTENLVSNVIATLDGSGTNVNLNGQIAAPDQDFETSGRIDFNIASLSPFSRLAGQQIGGALQGQGEVGFLPDLSRFDVDLTLQSQNLRTGIEQADLLLRGAGRYRIDATKNGESISAPVISVSTPVLSIDGSADAQGLNSGTATFNARLSDVGLFTDQLSGPLTAKGQASRRNGAWGINADATGPGGMTAKANGTVSDGMQMALDVTGALPLGLANNILAPRRITGNANFDLSVNGPATLDSVSGRLETQGARLAAPTLGRSLENINTTVMLSNGQAQVAASGTLNTGGDIQVNGPVGLTSPFNANLTTRISALKLRDPNLYSTEVAGQIALTGPLSGGARITGEMDVFDTELQVPSTGIGALGTLPDVAHVNAPASVRTTLKRAGLTLSGQDVATETGSGPEFPLDIIVNAPSRIFIRGRGLDAELGGQLRIGGTTNNVVPVGELSLIRGRLDILQQRFELSEGSASLQGDFIPYIRLVAGTTSNTGTVINIIVEGPASSPEVTFESVPELPQDEVLAQLIFGRDLSDISPLQAVQLAAAVGTLAGTGGSGVIDGLRQDLRLDDFDVTTDAEGNAAVRAGAYVSENVYTDVTVSADGTTDININLDITDEITAKGSVNNDGETSIGIFYERDY